MHQKDVSGTVGFTGVCWRLSRMTGVKANFFRAAFVVSALAAKATIALYLGLWLLFTVVE